MRYSLMLIPILLATTLSVAMAGGPDITDNSISAAMPVTCQKDCVDYFRKAWAIQGVITSGPGNNLSIGILRFAPDYSFGLTTGATVGSGNNNNQTYNISGFGGPRHLLRPCLYFAYGIDLIGTFGRQDHQSIKDDYSVGPYIGLDYYLSSHVVLSGFINPYLYSHQELADNSETSSNHIFSTGGLAISYLF